MVQVFLSTPCYGGLCLESYLASILQLQILFIREGIELLLDTTENESLVHRARNVSVGRFMQKTQAEIFMFIDADIGWEDWHLLLLLDRDVDVIGGLYPMKSLPIKWCVNGFDGAEEGTDGLQEVTKTGTGFMLIKRGVFEKLNAHPAVKPFVNDIGLAAELNPYMKTYFDTAVRENRYYSEDWTFCENWRDLGGKVWVDKRIMLKHTGTYVFDYAGQDAVYKQLHAIAMANPGGVAAPVDIKDTSAKVKTQVLADSKQVPKKKPSAKKPSKKAARA